MLTACPHLIYEFFPESKIINIVRDPIYVSESYKRFIDNLDNIEHKKIWGTYGDINLKDYAPHIRGVMAWIHYLKRFRDYNILNNNKNYLKINYSDFTNQT